jgi:hypothetical protein
MLFRIQCRYIPILPSAPSLTLPGEHTCFWSFTSNISQFQNLTNNLCSHNNYELRTEWFLQLPCEFLNCVQFAFVCVHCASRCEYVNIQNFVFYFNVYSFGHTEGILISKNGPGYLGLWEALLFLCEWRGWEITEGVAYDWDKIFKSKIRESGRYSSGPKNTLERK